MTIIYLPLEIKSREFEAKLALASRLVSNGCKVIIGQQWSLYKNLNNIPKGIFLFKSHNKIHQNAMKIAKNAGHIILALEEETMAVCTEKSLRKCSTKSLYDFADYIFVHGDFEKSFHDKEYGFPNKTIITGNPRIELLKKNYLPLYKDEIKKIKSRFGNFILINTNFGLTNSFMGDASKNFQISVNAGAYDPNNYESVQDYKDLVNWEIECAEGVYSIVQNLKNILPEMNIIIRPHPGEILENVVSKYSNIKNVFVIREGSHTPWTLASEFIIHPSCTTGLEALIGNKLAISYIPRKNWYSDQVLSNKVNKNFCKIKDLIEFLIKSRSDNYIESEVLQTLVPYLFNATENNSINKISDFILALELEKNQEDPYPLKYIKNSPRPEFQKEKCDFSKDELIDKFELLYKLTNENLNTQFCYQELDNSLYQISLN